MDYKQQICCGCGKPLSEDEDIVVCPVCGTPQHRECWEANGECVNAHRHSEGYAWLPSGSLEHETAQEDGEDPANALRCAACGAANSPQALTCIHCGAPISNARVQHNPFEQFFSAGGTPVNPFLYGVTLDPESDIEGAKVKDIVCVVQSGSARYIPKFKALADRVKKLSFNWAAFFFSPYWFFFRKMWKEGLLFAGLMLAITLPFTGVMQDFQEFYGSFYSMALTEATEAQLNSVSAQLNDLLAGLVPMFALSLLLHIVSGLFANPLYKKHVISLVKKSRVEFPQDREFEAVSLKKGGVSIFIAFASYFGYNIVYNLLLTLANYLIN